LVALWYRFVLGFKKKRKLSEEIRTSGSAGTAVLLFGFPNGLIKGYASRDYDRFACKAEISFQNSGKMYSFLFRYG